MKKKILSIVMMLSLVCTPIAFETNELDASSGMLKQSTVRKCKGTWYGKHKNHWHKAKKSKANKKWYAKGKNLGKKIPKACRR
ncbi:hypothetical protein LJB88_02485 [Erysipelotrichaceae bacterium OttesenSCG-928-M19]|nr:hypothetical protein [Erysipelotrichaceae bacterium OttesenSCG-928-M19]